VFAHRHVSVILNPAANGGGGARVEPELQAELSRRGLDFSLSRTEEPGHAEALARELVSRKPDLVLVVGGDGTVHEVANGLLSGQESPPPMGVVPVGTGNDFQKMAPASGGLRGTLDGIQAGAVRFFDVGRVRFGARESYFVNLLGVGVDVEILRRRERYPRLRGLPQYLAALVSALFSFRPDSFRVTLEPGLHRSGGETLEDRTLLMAITVGPSVGGGFLLNPTASPLDGLLDLFFVEPLGMTKLARYIPRVIRGSHLGLPEIVQRKIVSARIERSDGGPFFFEMDGEGMPDPVDALEIETCAGRLPVMVPLRVT
jgi:diacylglycerol kinase (ATP)